ncbi:hypothetical protein, partial [Chondromyces apiculatus]|uniref:hypothetical protein n=1 Tax=Chondromyces apiculatus TaxID=51 RepID=UPI0005C6DC48
MAFSVSFITLGPRVEYTPFGEDGLYVGAFGGVASVLGVPGPVGFGGAARVGCRLRPIPGATRQGWSGR